MPVTRREITLANYVAPVRVGLYPAEKHGAQPVRFDIVVEVAPRREAADDARTVLDYDRLREDVVAAAGARRYALLETLCEAVIARLEAHDHVLSARVSATKTTLFDDGSSVSVAVEWRRDG